MTVLLMVNDVAVRVAVMKGAENTMVGMKLMLVVKVQACARKWGWLMSNEAGDDEQVKAV